MIKKLLGLFFGSPSDADRIMMEESRKLHAAQMKAAAARAWKDARQAKTSEERALFERAAKRYELES